MSEITRIVLSVTGSDRPGLTSALSEAVLAAGGNWKEGHLSRLGGLYVGSVLVELEPANVAKLVNQVQAIDAAGLNVVINPAGTAPEGDRPQLLFELVGQDRPGIIKQVSSILAGLGANIESLSSGEVSGAWSGEHLFRAEVKVTLPDGVAPEDAQAALEEISGEIMVDFTFAAGD
ncbi:ACT domain-containing protein [Altererythrobacter sp. BO-6]|uniref:glycine cleavage system protein R n=1 Tax=Altererythrobacter sp. BO-6 TaxID=2604537 RepID=UPI0019D12104|nr:ACT domain-containing protein [Altererythrobacter sp. BO-6]